LPGSLAGSVSLATLEVTQGQRRFAFAFAVAMLAIACAATALARIPGYADPSVLAALIGAVIVTEVLSACLLFNQFLESRALWIAVVSAGYLATGLIVVGYLLTFPGVFSPHGFFAANDETALTLWCVWHLSFPFAALVAALAKWRAKPIASGRRPSALLLGLIAVCLLATTLLVYYCSRYASALPILLDANGFTPLMVRDVLPAICLVDVAAIASLVRRRAVTPLELWLPVAVLASMLDAIMGVIAARYSVVWYIGKFFAVASSSIMLTIYLAEIARISKALASANAQLHAISEHIARHDAVTGLPNRSNFEERVRAELLQESDRDRHVALLHVNLDRLGTINEAMGKATGDEVLREIGRRLVAGMRREDVVASLGGDEFGILLANAFPVRDFTAVAQDVQASIRQSLLAGGHRVFPSASIGIGIAPNDAITAEGLLGAAAAAMDLAKRSGGNQVRYYRAAMHEAAVERIRIESEMRTGLLRRQFRVYYQPIVDIASGRTVGAEALLRWEHPQHGLRSPDAFIPAAEQNGLMVPLGAWVLETVASQMRHWYDAGIDVGVAVNVSVREFQDPGFFDRLSEALRSQRVRPETLTVEITESLAIDESEQTRQTFSRCRDLGVNLSLDDFGTSHACLANVKRLPITSLKIDKSFIRDLPQNRTDAAIVTAVLAFAKNLGLSAVAEGIETLEQHEWLRGAGCALAQGYLFAPPMPVERFEARLRSEQRQTA
jgi:diguanylate cyclase (GGDEF)-like protein